MRKFFVYSLFLCFLLNSSHPYAQQTPTIDSLIKESKKMNNDSLKVDLLIQVGVSYMNEMDNENALTYLNKAFVLAKTIKYRKGEARALGTMGLVYSQIGDPQKAFEYHNKAKEIRLKIHDTQGLARSLINIGYCYYDQGNFQLALKNFQEAYQIRVKLGDKRDLADAYNSLGNVESKLGNFSESLKNYFAARKLFKEVNDFAAEGAALNNIGLIFKDKGDYQEASKYFFESLRIANEQQDLVGLIYGYNNMGLTYYMSKKFDSAQYYYNQSLQLAYKTDNKPGQSMALTNSAFLLCDQFKFKEALINHHKAFNLYKELKDTAGLANSYNNLGEVFILEIKAHKAVDSIENYKKAILYLDSGLLLSKKTGEKDRLRNSYGLLYQAYKGLKDYKKALENLELSKLMEDSLLNKEEYAKIAALQVNAEAEKAKMEQLISEERIKADARRKNTLAMAIATIILLSVAFTFYIVRQKILKAREIEKINTNHKLVELELQSLRAQLNPHFMFNSLNAIQELILKEDSDKSHLYLSRFSELLRLLLDNANEPFIPLSRELHLVDLYISLEKLRVSNLQYSINVKEKFDLDSVQIPNMILQPFIENAIWHGLAQKSGERKLTISVDKGETELILNIEDNGIGRKKAEELKLLNKKGHKSKGMELLSKRFQLLSKEYGSGISTKIIDLAETENLSGTRVNIKLPLKIISELETSVE